MAFILLVEQDVWLGELYQRLLANEHTVTIVRSAQDAIDRLDSGTIDLIIMDIMMGRHNGVELLYEIRSYEDWADIPIALLSSLPQEEFPVRDEDWQRYGVIAFLYKPHTKPTDIAATVRQFVAT